MKVRVNGKLSATSDIVVPFADVIDKVRVASAAVNGELEIWGETGDWIATYAPGVWTKVERVRE